MGREEAGFLRRWGVHGDLWTSRKECLTKIVDGTLEIAQPLYLYPEIQVDSVGGRMDKQ